MEGFSITAGSWLYVVFYFLMCAMLLVYDCRQLISQIAQVQIDRCFREANMYANLLVRLGTKQDRTL